MEIVKTADGSHTLYLKKIDESYHSTFGAVTESKHVFINAGFHYLDKDNIGVFEVGFGTGLNAMLTLIESQKSNKKITYYAVELCPLEMEIIRQLNYSKILSLDDKFNSLFFDMHSCKWDVTIELTDYFKLYKIKGNLESIEIPEGIQLVYFDAFSPDKQPEMWTSAIFQRIYNKLLPSAVLTTYCAKGEIKRILKSIGFKIENLQGPPGKREMIRALK